MATEITLTGYSTKNIFRSMIFASYGMHTTNYVHCVFGDFCAWGMQDAEVTELLMLQLV